MRSLALCLALLASACAVTSDQPHHRRFSEHVAWLAADAREGRQTGTEGFEAASAYVAGQFALYGLEPAGDDGSWYQTFEAQGQRQLVAGNDLYLDGERMVLDQEWLPFATSPSDDLEAPLVFAGYGITTDEGEDQSRDDYEGIDVEGKVVVVFRRGPVGMGQPDGSGYWLSGKGQRHVTTSAKINNAFQHGAAGIVIVNDPRGHGEGGAADVPIPYGTAGAAAVSSLPAVSLTWAAARRVLDRDDIDLEMQQVMLDHDVTASRPLPGTLSLTVRAEREVVTTRNVIARLPGSDPTVAHEYVVIGAHLDHLGHGRRSGSMGGAEAVGRIHNGADDNASGSAGLLEIARSLAARPTAPRRSVVFMAFGAEEWGLLGSRHWIAEPTLPLEDCVAMLNMDMIGRSGTGRVEVGGVGTAAEFAGLLDEALGLVDTPLQDVRSPGVTGNSDHAPFVEKRIPTLSLFTGLHDEYHTPEDDIETIDARHGAAIAALAGEVAVVLADLTARPAFVEPRADPAPASSADPHDGQAVVGYGVSFGSRPDMTYQGEDGVRVAGVREGSSAERCGLRGGDIIVALDGKPIRNLEDYSVLLFSHRPGDEIVVTVLRDGEPLELTALLEGRRGDT